MRRHRPGQIGERAERREIVRFQFVSRGFDDRQFEVAVGARAAVSASFDRVFWTLFDTHVTSLIAAAFLFQFGTGPIRGFATTLAVGLISNLFTSIFVSRTLFEFVLSRRPANAQTVSI